MILDDQTSVKDLGAGCNGGFPEKPQQRPLLRHSLTSSSTKLNNSSTLLASEKFRSSQTNPEKSQINKPDSPSSKKPSASSSVKDELDARKIRPVDGGAVIDNKDNVDVVEKKSNGVVGCNSSSTPASGVERKNGEVNPASRSGTSSTSSETSFLKSLSSLIRPGWTKLVAGLAAGRPAIIRKDNNDKSKQRVTVHQVADIRPPDSTSSSTPSPQERTGNNCNSRALGQIALLFVRDDSSSRERMRTLHKLVAAAAVLPTLAVCLTLAIASTPQWRYPVLPWQAAYLNLTENADEATTTAAFQRQQPPQPAPSPYSGHHHPAALAGTTNKDRGGHQQLHHMLLREDIVHNLGDVGFISVSDVHHRAGESQEPRQQGSSGAAFRRRTGDYVSNTANRDHSSDLQTNSNHHLGFVSSSPPPELLPEKEGRNGEGNSVGDEDDADTTLQIRIKGTVGYRYPGQSTTTTAGPVPTPFDVGEGRHEFPDTAGSLTSPPPWLASAVAAAGKSPGEKAAMLAALRRKYELAQTRWLQQQQLARRTSPSAAMNSDGTLLDHHHRQQHPQGHQHWQAGQMAASAGTRQSSPFLTRAGLEANLAGLPPADFDEVSPHPMSDAAGESSHSMPQQQEAAILESLRRQWLEREEDTSPSEPINLTAMTENHREQQRQHELRGPGSPTTHHLTATSSFQTEEPVNQQLTESNNNGKSDHRSSPTMTEPSTPAIEGGSSAPKKPFGLGWLIPKIPSRKKSTALADFLTKQESKQRISTSQSTGIQLPSFDPVRSPTNGAWSEGSAAAKDEEAKKVRAEFAAHDDDIPDALTVEDLIAGKLDIETGIEEAVKAAYKSRGLDIDDPQAEERCDPYDHSCTNKLGEAYSSSTSTSGYQQQQESSGGIRQYVSKGNFFRDRRFNLFVTGLLRNLAIEIRNFDNDPLFFRVYRPFEIEPGTFDLTTFVLGRNFRSSRQSNLGFVAPASPSTSPPLTDSAAISTMLAMQPRTTLLERLMSRFGHEGRMKSGGVMMMGGGEAAGSSTSQAAGGGLLGGLRMRNSRNRRRVVGGGVLRGLSNVTRTDDAQIQVLGPSSTLVRSDVALGPLTMELKLTMSRRRGLLRRRNEEDRIIVNVGKINLQTFTFIDDHGSSMADFNMAPVDIDRVQITLPEIRRLQQQTSMQDTTREIVLKIFSTKGFLARRLEEYTKTAMTSNMYSDTKKNPIRGAFQAIEYQ